MVQSGTTLINTLLTGYPRIVPTPPTAGVQAVWSDLVVDSVGVGIKDASSAGYTNTTQTLNLLTGLGVRHVRWRQYAGSQGAGQMALFNALYSAGINSMGPISAVPNTGPVFGPTDVRGPEQIILFLSKNAPPGSIDYFEGCNEPNLQGNQTIDPVTGLPQWALDVRALQARMYAAAKGQTTAATWGDQATADAYNRQIPDWIKQVPVLSPALGLKKDYTTLGDMSALCDMGAIHLYQQGTSPSVQINSQLIQAHNNNTPGKLEVFTEGGYFTALKSPGGYPVSVKATGFYDPRRVMRFWAWHPAMGNPNGVARTYRYQLMDQGVSQTDNQQAYGIVLNNGTPKDGYIGMKNLISLLADPGTPYAPGKLDFQVLNAPADLDPPILLQRRDGTFLIVLEREVQVWDRTNLVDITVPPANFTVKFGPLVSGQVFSPSTSSSAVASFAGDAVPVSVAGGLVVVACKPIIAS